MIKTINKRRTFGDSSDFSALGRQSSNKILPTDNDSNSNSVANSQQSSLRRGGSMRRLGVAFGDAPPLSRQGSQKYFDPPSGKLSRAGSTASLSGIGGSGGSGGGAPGLLSRANSVIIQKIDGAGSFKIDDGVESGITCSNCCASDFSLQRSRRTSSSGSGGTGTGSAGMCISTLEENFIKRSNKGARQRKRGPSVKALRKKARSGRVTLDSFGKITIITDNILLGGRENASSKSELLEYGVTHILNCAQQLPLFFPNDFICMKVPMLDSPTHSIERWISKCLAFLDHVEAVGGRCLVHCISGVSRSVTIVIMHFMIKHKLDLKTIFNYIKAKRSA